MRVSFNLVTTVCNIYFQYLYHLIDRCLYHLLFAKDRVGRKEAMAQKTFDEAEIASAVLVVLNSRDRRSLEASSVRGSASSPSVLPTSPPLESSSSSRYAHVADTISVQQSMSCRYRRPTVYDGQMQTWRKRRSKGEPKRAAKRRQGHMYNKNVFLLPAKDEPLLSRHSDGFSIPRGEFRAHLIDQGLLARVQFCGDASADEMRETLL